MGFIREGMYCSHSRVLQHAENKFTRITISTFLIGANLPNQTSFCRIWRASRVDLARTGKLDLVHGTLSFLGDFESKIEKDKGNNGKELY